MQKNTCEYCKKEFGKYNLKKHLQTCKAKVEYEKNQVIRDVCNKKFFLDYSKNDFSPLTNLPKDLIIIVFSYIEGDKDKYCSFRKMYKEYVNYCLVSKKIYNLIYPEYEKILEYKVHLKEEREKRICKKTAKTVYKLSDEELDNNIPHELYKNPHFSSSSPMKVYYSADVLDYVKGKYGSYSNHQNLLLQEYNRKQELKTKKQEAANLRNTKFIELMKKYNIIQGNYLYNKFYKDYVDKGKIGIKKIEEHICSIINKSSGENNINEEMDYDSNYDSEYDY